MTASRNLHGHDLLAKEFTVSQVVHDYGDVCQTITELALEAILYRDDGVAGDPQCGTVELPKRRVVFYDQDIAFQ